MNKNVTDNNEMILKMSAFYNYDFQITTGVKNLSIERIVATYIPCSEFQNLLGEHNGSPFTYTYKYSEWNGRGNWMVDKTSEGSFYLGEDMESFNEYDLHNVINENLNHPNFGKELSDKIWRMVKRINENELDISMPISDANNLLIPFQLLVLCLSFHNEYMINILFHRDEFEDLQYLTDWN